MANWCSTNITFHSENKEQIIKLHSVLSELDVGESLLPNDFGNLWLGNILHRFGYKWQEITCRGLITLLGSVYEDADGHFYFEIEEEDAWAPMTEVWDTVLSEEEYSDIEISYIAEEPGCEVYQKHGMWYEEKYYLDDETDLLNGGNSYFITDKDLVKTVKKQIKNYLQSVDSDNIFDKNIKITTIEDIYTFIEKFNEEYPDMFLSLHEFEEV